MGLLSLMRYPLQVKKDVTSGFTPASFYLWFYGIS